MNQISLALCVTIAICVVGHIGASPLMKRNEATEARNYVKCVEDMQNNCEKSRTPYEVLIQGPVGSRFVRSLLSDDSKAQKATNPNQRSSITIFKPEDNKESVPAAEIESADKAKTDEAAKDDAKAKDVEEVPAKIEEPTKPENQAEAAKEEVKSNTEEKAKRDVEKAEAKANAGETIKTDDAAKTAAENTDDKKEDAPEEPKKDETAEQPKAEESADKPSETEKDAEKKLKKRGADDELESVVDVFAKETDGAKSEADSSKTNEGTTEPTVGIALPGVLGLKPLVPGLVGLKAAPALVALRAHLDLKKAALAPKFAPLHARVAALGAKTKAGLAGLGLPILPIV